MDVYVVFEPCLAFCQQGITCEQRRSLSLPSVYLAGMADRVCMCARQGGGEFIESKTETITVGS